MGDHSLFLSKFLRHGTQIASLAPSSPWLSQATVSDIPWGRIDCLLELGAGTGPITKVLAERARPETRILAIERDADFVRLLHERFADRPNVEVIEADVNDLTNLLSTRGIDRVDEVVSGLPLPSFPPALRATLFDQIRNLVGPDAGFHQITELPWLYLGLYQRYFEQVRFQFVARNVPPGGVYHCRGLRHAPVGNRP